MMPHPRGGGDQVRIRAARASELPALQAIERAAGPILAAIRSASH
jgi:hypothetical protein